MTIASELEDLQTNLANAKAAVVAKGGTVGDTGLAGLANEIRTIDGGGGDDPGDWGLVEYYDSFDLDVTNISGEECTADVEDSSLLLKMVMNSPMYHGDDNVWLSFDFSPGYGWTCWELGDEPFTTAELQTECGIVVSDFDEQTANWAMIMIEGTISQTPGVPPIKRLLESEEEYESLTSDGSAIVPIISIAKFSFGRLCSSIPDNFLSNARSLEYVDTTYADNIVEIGNYVLYGCGKLVSNLTFQNVTTVGDYMLAECPYGGTLTLPNVEVVGDYGFVSFYKLPVMPKIRIAGDGFLQRFHGEGINFGTAYPTIERIGRECLRYSRARNIDFYPANWLPNLQFVGAGVGCVTPCLESVEIASGLIDCFEADTDRLMSFGESPVTLPYLAGGIKLTSDNRQAVLNKFPEASSSATSLARKWRS